MSYHRRLCAVIVILAIVITLVSSCTRNINDVQAPNYMYDSNDISHPHFPDNAYEAFYLIGRFMRLNPNHPVTLNIHSMALIGDDRVYIRMAEYNEDQVELFKATVFDSPLLVFEQSLGPYEVWG